jgi:hypothetical protein
MLIAINKLQPSFSHPGLGRILSNGVSYSSRMVGKCYTDQMKTTRSRVLPFLVEEDKLLPSYFSRPVGISAQRDRSQEERLDPRQEMCGGAPQPYPAASSTLFWQSKLGVFFNDFFTFGDPRLSFDTLSLSSRTSRPYSSLARQGFLGTLAEIVGSSWTRNAARGITRC